jgi:hypothetical protein
MSSIKSATDTVIGGLRSGSPSPVDRSTGRQIWAESGIGNGINLQGAIAGGIISPLRLRSAQHEQINENQKRRYSRRSFFFFRLS